MTKGDTKKARWKKRFLDALRVSPNASAAAKAAKRARQYVYRERDTDPAFANDWDDALGEALDNLEGEMYRRAYEGVEKPIYQKGIVVGTVLEYSDGLAQFIAKAYLPKYRDTLKTVVVGEVKLIVVYDDERTNGTVTPAPPETE